MNVCIVSARHPVFVILFDVLSKLQLKDRP